MEENWVIFIVGIIFCLFGLIFALTFLIFNIKFMRLRFIKMTSPRVNITLILGTLALYTSSLLIVTPSDAWTTTIQTILYQCRCWLLTLGFTVTFGSMLVKGWRVHRLFQYPRTNTVTIKDGSLFGGLAILVLLDVGILISWQLIDPVLCGDSHQFSIHENDCTSEHYSIWMIVILIYKYILILMCCYIGWQIRHVTFPALDDSRCLLLGSGLTLTLTGAVCLVIILFPNSHLALSAVMSAFLWIGATAVLVISFLPKVLVVYRSKGSEPLMGSASKYVQQPVSDDIGTEIVKILGENRYLKRKLEERDTLVSHLKKKLASDLHGDSDSHQTSSANYSLTSTTTTALNPNKSKLSSSLSCCLSLCCDTSDKSMKATQGTPIGDRDISVMSVKTVDVLTMPAVIEQQCLHSYLALPSLATHNTIKKLPDEEILHTANSITPTITVTHATANEYANTIQQADSGVVHELDHPQTVTVDSTDPPLSHSDKLYINDIDLLCSIADTYDLGGDSDTLSYISNCLHSRSTWSLQRRSRRASQTLGQCAMLGSDQLYPDSMLKSSRSKPKKHRRRQSVATTSNVYMNERGKPLII